MDTRPIGIFDSGLGGLTAVRKLRELLPGEDLIYLGDNARVPYGNRSRETILRYAREDAAFLLSQNVKAILIACGTVSSNAIRELQSFCPVPVLGIVEHTARSAAAATRNGRIAVAATAATIRSHAFSSALAGISPDAEVLEKSCPLLVPLVEDGRVSPEEPLLRLALSEYLAEVTEFGADTLILGCTHYPLISTAMDRILSGSVTLVDSGSETAKALAALLEANGLLSGKPIGGDLCLFVTDAASHFSELASLFLGAEAGEKIRKVSLEPFQHENQGAVYDR